MKKLMAVATVALCAAVTFGTEAIQSANIVGFNTVTLKQGWNMMTVSFQCVTNASTGLSIQDLFPGTTEGLTSNADISLADQIQVYDAATGGYDIYYLYYTTSTLVALKKKNYKWVNAIDNSISTKTFKDGDAFWYKKAGGTAVTISVSGQVSMNPAQNINIVTGWNMIGNAFPVNYNPNLAGVEYWQTCGAVGNADVSLADQIQVYDTSADGYDMYYLYYTTSSLAALKKKNYKWVAAIDNSVVADDAVVIPVGAAAWYKHAGEGFNLIINNPVK